MVFNPCRRVEIWCIPLFFGTASRTIPSLPLNLVSDSPRADSGTWTIDLSSSITGDDQFCKVRAVSPVCDYLLKFQIYRLRRVNIVFSGRDTKI
ncbi:hypothetical protein BC936DRAFT_142883 [Jimgerdemannia flammicorona]|uniref:Uncharacterized protein n=1 Tax=Jimgerdemannia flammicorona TaxID=994334 RepID=A0A432ZZP4_9FUNG|nr:hypothetical protein BC936DRAFT_142883 [Jimgerdemannia flammicorona]